MNIKIWAIIIALMAGSLIAQPVIRTIRPNQPNHHVRFIGPPIHVP